MSIVTVVNIHSLSYSGSTWINLILGCHKDAMALGPLDRFWHVLNGNIQHDWWVVGQNVNTHCLVHGDLCDFWPHFVDQYSVSQNLFLSLNEYTGKSIFTTNNISDSTIIGMLEHPDIEVKNIYLIRDGRDLVASYTRKFNDKTYLQGITEFLQPSFSYFEFNKNDTNNISIRYEDMMSGLCKHIDLFSKFIGIDYEQDALQFWKRRHHLVGGNPGTIATLRLAEGLDVVDFKGAVFYREQFRRLQQLGPKGFVNQHMTESMTRQDLFLFDCLAGEDNARFGYSRDEFTPSERRDFGKILPRIVSEHKLPEHYIKQLRPHFTGPYAFILHYITKIKKLLCIITHKVGYALSFSKLQP